MSKYDESEREMTALELADVFNTYAEPHDWGKQAQAMLRQQQAEIGRLIGAEPVAIRYNFDGYGYRYMDSGSGSDWQTRVIGEPLYTHPIGELSDEEIYKIAFHFEEEIEEYASGKWAIPKQDFVDFVRAILKKAREKL